MTNYSPACEAHEYNSKPTYDQESLTKSKVRPVLRTRTLPVDIVEIDSKCLEKYFVGFEQGAAHTFTYETAANVC